MPEAAEVEIVRQGLLPLVNQELEDLWVTEKLPLGSEHSALNELPGQRLVAIERRGKLLGFHFANQQVLTAHLRMTGYWNIVDRSGPDYRQQLVGLRAQLLFAQQSALFIDRRGFATVGRATADDWTAGLGPELLDLPDGWHPAPAERQRKRAIKAALLDQSVAAGVGNYLADETLWHNQVHPQTPGQELTATQWAGLYQHARDLARQALAAGGTTFRDFSAVDGQAGQGQALLLAYGQAGKPCARCQAPLAKSKVAGRGSTYCQDCQQLGS
jgi:formamidopyrimidine-DNA glycosylase